jgi:hypothetical protein
VKKKRADLLIRARTTEGVEEAGPHRGDKTNNDRPRKKEKKEIGREERDQALQIDNPESEIIGWF